jgi:GMP synthase (glutamine-hydrolysing)
MNKEATRSKRQVKKDSRINKFISQLSTSLGDRAPGNRLLKDTGAFQYMAILHEDVVTGMRDGLRNFGQQIEVRCWESVDARVATPKAHSFDVLERLAKEIIRHVPGIVSVTYNIATKPPSTIEAI